MPSASLLLGVSLLLLCALNVSAVSFNVRPNLQQFFSGDPVSLSCGEDGRMDRGWTVKRTAEGQSQQCGADRQDFGLFVNSTCVLDLLSSYSGAYWCETSSGRRSDQISLTVFHRADIPFILEIPALPVVTGSDVTLRCRHKDGSTRAAYFFRNNTVAGDPVQQFTISNVQQSDEGSYKCSTDVSDPSPQSWLRVREPPQTRALYTSVDAALTAPPTPSSSTPSLTPLPHPLPPVSVLRLIVLLVVLSLYCVCTVLMASVCCSRKTGCKETVTVEMTPRDDHADDVTTEHDLRPAQRNSAMT